VASAAVEHKDAAGQWAEVPPPPAAVASGLAKPDRAQELASMVRVTIYEALSTVLEQSATASEEKLEAAVWAEDKARLEQQLMGLSAKLKQNELFSRHVSGASRSSSTPFPRLLTRLSMRRRSRDNQAMRHRVQGRTGGSAEGGC
jgi:hypothetical protein